MRLSNYIASLLLTLSSMSAFATTSTLNFSPSGNASFANSYSTNNEINDTYTFSIADGFTGFFEASISNTFASVGNEIFYGIYLGSVTLMGSSLIGQESSEVVAQFSSASLNAQNWSFTGPLVAGNYSLSILGNALLNGSPIPLSYGGIANITISPVPESETSSMMLLGLGLMGFIAMRRKDI